MAKETEKLGDELVITVDNFTKIVHRRKKSDACNIYIFNLSPETSIYNMIGSKAECPSLDMTSLRQSAKTKRDKITLANNVFLIASMSHKFFNKGLLPICSPF